MFRLLPLAFAVLLPLPALGADDDKGKWVSTTASVTAEMKTGDFAKTAGVTVDPTNGDVYLILSDRGMWKSTDKGGKFERVDNKTIGGRCETGYALNFDPAGKRLFCFMIYGDSSYTDDAGKTWAKSKVSHLDFGAVDWADTGKCLLSIRHESGGMLTTSTDAGKSWTDLGKGFTRVGMFDSKTFVCSKGKGLIRSEDAGKTWADVSDVTPPGLVMAVRDGVGYWVTEKGLLVSKDKGKTWAIQGAAIAAVQGPYFGKTADHIIVSCKDGLHETKDAGKTWAKAIPLPDGFKASGVGPNYAYDPVNDIFYASSMGRDAFRFKR